MMKLTLAFVSPRSHGKNAAADALAEGYIARAGRLESVAMTGFETEAALLAGAERAPGRAGGHLVLFDSRGELMTSEQFAGALGKLRDAGAQRVLCCVGPADGWSKEALAKAQRVISLGRMTLPHELARVVVAEQIYRALTILAGHPYHCGH